MKKLFLILLGVVLAHQCIVSQNIRERRLYLNEYVSPDELVSMSKTLVFDKAMLLFSDFTKKYLNKIVVDATNNKKEIGIDIVNMYWIQAFETVLRANQLWYDERDEFLYVYAPIDSIKLTGTQAKATVSVPIDTTAKVLLRQRDVRISSVFFTVDVAKSLNAGINWSFFYTGDTTAGRPTQFGSELYSGITDPKQQQTGTGGTGNQAIPPGFFGA